MRIIDALFLLLLPYGFIFSSAIISAGLPCIYAIDYKLLGMTHGQRVRYFVGLYVLFYGFYKIFQRDCWFFQLSGLTTFQSANPFREKIPSSYATRSLERHSVRML